MTASPKRAGPPKHFRPSDRDRAYFRRLARFEQEGHDEALSRHMARTGSERLINAVQMMLDGAYFTARFPTPDDDDPSPLYARARRLGLYRP
ncbi:MAG TPA: hypothetical protein VFY90_13545 [Tepidiformaceae bacterium]|nr:hypothetical protein [Tepidiformaceae bacterium]